MTFMNFMGGAQVGASETSEKNNPSDTGDIVGAFARCGAAEVDEAVGAARTALPGLGGLDTAAAARHPAPLRR